MSRTRTRHAEADYAPRLFVSACALEGGGKTHFALTAPDPIDLFSIDPNTDDVVEKFRATGKTINLRKYRLPGILASKRQAQADDIWTEFVNDIGDLVEDDSQREGTIVLDVATVFYHLMLTADHGKLQEIPQWSRAKSNANWMSFLGDLKQAGRHVVLLHRLRNKWEGEEGSRRVVEGEFERDGCSKTGFAVNTEVFLFHDPDRPEPVENQFGMRIVRCTARPALKEKEYWGVRKDGTPRVDFPALAKLVYPDHEW